MTRRGAASWATVLVVLIGAGVLGAQMWRDGHTAHAEGTGTVTTPTTPSSTPASSPMPVPSATPAGDYFTVLGPAQRLYTPTTAGVLEYCPVDELGRAVCAYGELTSSQRASVRGMARQPITVEPAGWGHNSIVTISAASGVPGSTSYRGWFWNRSHLVADSLGGATTAENLITGTRTQNVGSTKADGEYAGGMAAAEIQARHYLDSRNGDVCPLYYAATPQYTGDELIPRTVIVDMQSCDQTLNERIEISNTATGWAIDYTTGTFTPAN